MLYLDIYGHGKNTQKSKSYTPSEPALHVPNLSNTVDKDLHGQKRRIVGLSFTPASLSSFEPIVLKHVRSTCQHLCQETRSGWPLVTVEDWSLPHEMVSRGKAKRHHGLERQLTMVDS